MNKIIETNCYEGQYLSILREIYKNGVEEKNERTGHYTKRLFGQTICVDLEKEFPILTSKRIFWKSAIEEIFWIFRDFSNNIHDLRPHIWDQWADETGSIGKAYGYQVGQPVKTMQGGKLVEYPNQVQYVLETLAKDQSDRRCIMTLWNRTELADMGLNPCCHTTTWVVHDGRLNCMLDQRSGDFPVGVPFNTTQYAALTIMFARHLGLRPGTLFHTIADAHIYDNQMDGVSEQLANAVWMITSLACETNSIQDGFKKSGCTKMETYREILNKSEPHLVFHGSSTNWFDQTIEDIELQDYVSCGTINYEVVV